MSQQTQDRQERIARNEAAFRQANEQVAGLNHAGAKMPSFPIVCECGSHGCMDVLEVRADLYESVRSVAHHFLLIPGHESPDVERVVENHGEFVVVAKHPGEPRRLAKESDPRADGQAVSPAVAVRIAENEARFRDANEHIEEAVLRLEASAPTLPFVCECGRAECLKTLRLTIEEYEQAREDSRYFVCVPGHEIVGENVGRVVRTNGHFVLVEKQGDAGVIADRLDPRSNGESGRVEPERRHGEDVA